MPTGLSETEQRLAKIWRTALRLSPEKYAALNPASSLDAFLIGGSTIKRHFLKEQIEETFGVVMNEVASDTILKNTCNR